jgi:hypothetical protein
MDAIVRLTRALTLIAVVASCRASRDSGTPATSAQVPHSATPLLIQPAETSSADTATLVTTAQDSHAELRGAGSVIDSIFKHELGESPRMGWLLPGRFLAAERHLQVYVWSTASIVTTTYERTLNSRDHKRIAEETHLACDTKGPLAQYTMTQSELGSRERAFYTSAPPPHGTQVGLTARPLLPSELSGVHAVLADPESRDRFRDTALVVRQGQAFYSIDAAYDTAGVFLKSALVLHDSLGANIASHIDDASAFSCDGCGDPVYDEGLGRLYDVRGAFVVPGFPYPILLLDTGTVEGRALSMVTFASDGAYAEYRIYEYVVECILGPG